MSVSSALRQRVSEAADHRCEYCHSPQHLVFDILQVDHIHPIALGGMDVVDNLCLAYSLCNRYKGMQISAPDPLNGMPSTLFNPRIDLWNEHFSWDIDGTRIWGITARGRATIIALHLNNHIAMRVRREWVSTGWHPPKP